MKNIRTTNEKLRHRELRILSRATGLPAAEASRLFKKAGPERAEELLPESGNRVSAANSERVKWISF